MGEVEAEVLVNNVAPRVAMMTLGDKLTDV